jgi:hypothetical protein
VSLFFEVGCGSLPLIGDETAAYAGVPVDLYVNSTFCFRQIKKHEMVQVIVSFSDVKFMTSCNGKACLQIKINCPLIPDPGV